MLAGPCHLAQVSSLDRVTEASKPAVERVWGPVTAWEGLGALGSSNSVP